MKINELRYFANVTIVNFSRDLPAHETQAAADTITSIFNCRFWNLPPAVLVHSFFKTKHSRYKSLQSYIRCLDDEMEEPDCFYSDLCGKRLRESAQKDQRCKQILDDVYNRRLSCSSHVDEHLQCTSRNMTACAICRYDSCLQEKLTRARSCLDILEDKCRSASIRVVKTVRLTMNTIETIRKQNPTVKVVQHYRDPKEVVWARRDDPNSRSNTFQYSPAHEAVIYCTQLSKDISIGLKMIPTYADKLLVVSKYSDIKDRPLEAARALYNFINKPVPINVYNWVSKQIKDGHITKDNVLQDMPSDVQQRVDKACKSVYKLLDYPITPPGPGREI